MARCKRCDEQKKERLGVVKANKYGVKAKCVEYNSATDMTIEFDDGEQTKCTWQWFSSGVFTRKGKKNQYGGYTYNYKYPEILKDSKAYATWYDMLIRCFNEDIKEKQVTYKGVTCDKEWLDYNNFYEWIITQENYEVWKEDYRSCLDKDILCKNNKIYSKDTCCLVPALVNSLFTKRQNHRGTECIGVTLDRKMGNFRANCNDPFSDKVAHLGHFNTEQEAFAKYKEYKENAIKEVAKVEYEKGAISKQCYEAMFKYEVEFTD